MTLKPSGVAPFAHRASPVPGQHRLRPRTAVTGTGPAEPAMAALAGLVHAGGIADLIYPGAENAALRARLAELAGQDPATGGSSSGGDSSPSHHHH